jgi:hypothetical protein
MHLDLFAEWDRFEAASGLADGNAARRRSSFERFVAQQFRLDSSPSDEVHLFEDQFAAFRYRGVELDEIQRLMLQSERILQVLPTAIRTTLRSLDRFDLRHSGRPIADATYWESQFPSRAELDEHQRAYDAELETAERVRQQHERSAHEAQIAREQMLASQRRVIEAYQDNLAASAR